MLPENREVWRWEQNNIKLWILKKRNQLKYDVLHFWIFNFLRIYWIQFYFYDFCSKTNLRRLSDWNKSFGRSKKCTRFDFYTYRFLISYIFDVWVLYMKLMSGENVQCLENTPKYTESSYFPTNICYWNNLHQHWNFSCCIPRRKVNATFIYFTKQIFFIIFILSKLYAFA